MNQQTAIVILNYNGIDFLAKFLPILIENTAEAQIIIADNASTDDSVNFLNTNFPEIRIIKLFKNFGFAEGYNHALKQVDTRYYVLLNSDVEVTKNWLPPLINQLENQSVAACQPKILSFSNKEYFEYAGAAGGFIDYFGYPFCRGRIISNVEKDNGQYDDAKNIFWATGACLAIKADLFHAVAGFDGDFFAHMEEIDLCWRLQNAGYDIIYTSESKVYHVGGGTLPKSNSFKSFLNFRNGLFMVYKNFPKKNFYLRIFLRMILDGLAGLSYFIKGNFADFEAVFKAHMAFYKNLGKLNAKRKNLQTNQQVKSKLATEYSKSIIWEFLKNSKLKFSDLKF